MAVVGNQRRTAGAVGTYIRAVPVGSGAIVGATIPGVMLSFDYLFWQHDPRPLIITCRYVGLYGANLPENLLAGFNLHYLPFGLIRMLIRGFTNDPQGTIRAGLRHQTTKLVYRTYKIKGISQARRIDWNSFMQRVAIMRQFTAAEREALIRSVELQLTQNPRDLTAINRLVADIVTQRTAAPPPPTPVQPPSTAAQPPAGGLPPPPAAV